MTLDPSQAFGYGRGLRVMFVQGSKSSISVFIAYLEGVSIEFIDCELARIVFTDEVKYFFGI